MRDLRTPAFFAFLKSTALGLVYYFLAVWGLHLSFQNTNATPIWPPSGVAFAALFLFGYRLWPGIWAGAFCANFMVFTSNHFAELPAVFFLSFFIAVGNTLEAVLGVFLLKGLTGMRDPLLRISDIFKFVIAAAVAAFASATISAAMVTLFKSFSQDMFKSIWYTWWLGDLLSLLVLVPSFLVLRTARLKKVRLKRLLEALALVALVAGMNFAIFGGQTYISAKHLPVGYLMLPLTVWSAYRFSYLGVTAVSILTTFWGFYGTVHGLGPFVGHQLNWSLLLLQSFVGILTLTGLVLAAALHERQKAEEDMLRSSQRFQALVENSQDMVCLLDHNAMVFYASPAITTVLGYPLEEYVGRHILELIHPEDRAEITAKLKTVFSTPGAVVQGECRCQHKEGVWRWVEGMAHNMLSDPAVKAIVVNYRDITQRKESGEVQRYLAAIIENSDEAIIGKSLDGTITSWNKGAQQLYGYTAGEMIGRPVTVLAPLEKEEEITDILRQIRQGNTVQLPETVRVTKSGRRLDVLLTVSPIRDSAGHVIGASAIAHDITERKRSQMALQESELRFRTMADTAPVMVWMSGADMICTFFNKAWLDFRGETLEHELGHGWVEGLSLEDVKRCWAFYMKSFVAREKFTMDYRLRRADGAYRWILATGVPRFTADGQFEGYIGSCIDITERKLAEDVLKRDKHSLEQLVDERSKELLSTQKELKQASRLADIGTLAATVAHELRNPLGVIQMAAYNLKKKSKNPEADKHLINIEKKVWEGNRIIDNLLSYSRIKIPSYEKVPLLSVLDECVSSTQSRFNDYDITIERKYNMDGVDYIEADPHQVREVFVNVLNNACQAFPGKGGKIEVIVEGQEDNTVSIMVRDNGEGIEESDLARIFEPFFTRKSKGTGLGLTICNELVLLHHGRIEVKSRKGRGTSVNIILPISRNGNG